MSDLEIYRRQVLGNPIGFGRKSVLRVVDFTGGFNDPRLFGGGNIGPAVKRTVGLLGFFRERQPPAAFTRVVYAEDGSDGGVLATKQPRLLILTEAQPAAGWFPNSRRGPASSSCAITRLRRSSARTSRRGSSSSARTRSWSPAARPRAARARDAVSVSRFPFSQ
jgi:maleamate amidohydrolase